MTTVSPSSRYTRCTGVLPGAVVPVLVLLLLAEGLGWIGQEVRSRGCAPPQASSRRQPREEGSGPLMVPDPSRSPVVCVREGVGKGICGEGMSRQDCWSWELGGRV
jgi:hypothetical protein